MFRMLILQALNNLSDEQVDDQVRDRPVVHAISAARHRGQHSGCHAGLAVPRAGLIEKLFDRFDSTFTAKDTWRVADIWLTPRSCRSPCNETVLRKTGR
jgi:hypothetical protein